MPLALALVGSAIIGGGASMLASNHAANVSQQATDQSIAAQQAQYQQTRADEAPYVQAGYGALNALRDRLGLPTQGAGATATTSQPGVASGQPDWNAYLAANPDLQTYYQQNAPALAQNGITSPEAYAQAHYAKYGQSEGRTLPTAGASPAPAATNALTGAAVGSSGMSPQTSPAVTDGSGAPGAATSTGQPGIYGNPNPTFTDPGSYQAPTPYAAPTYNAPAPFSFTAGDYQASPGYAYQVDQALKGALASSSATGALQSGATLKALEDRASNLANQDFYNQRNFAFQNYTDNRNFGRQNYVDDRTFGEGQYQDLRNFGAGQFNTDRAFNYGQATDARNYLTGAYNTGTSNLFQLAGLGQGAAGGVAAAGQASTNGTVNALTSNAATSANAGIAGANAVSSFLGSGVNALAYSQGRNAATGAAAKTYTAASYPGLDF